MDPLFQVHRLNDLGQSRAGSTAKAFNALLDLLRSHIKPGRELAICEMKLEEACFFAKKAIAADLENRYVPKSRRRLAQMAADRKKPRAKGQELKA